MDFVNPPFAFVLVDGVIAPRIFASFYRRYAATIELDGNEVVLEFGCGSGGISERLASRLGEGSLKCVDISPPMLRIAQRRLKKHNNVQCFVGRIEDLAVDRNSVDVVIIHNALHDVEGEERQATVDALVSTLKPGGRLCFREPTKPLHGLPVAEYREMMLKAGLSEARAREYKVFPIGWVFDAVFVKGVSEMRQNPSE